MPLAPIARAVNLALLVAFPVAWFVPLIRTGLFPEWRMPGWMGGGTLFGPDAVSVISGLQALWGADVPLALAVTFFALVAPMAKCAGLALIHFGLLDDRARGAIGVMGKLAMADNFILALVVVIAKGIGVGTVEVAWGMYLFGGCVIASLLVALVDGRAASG